MSNPSKTRSLGTGNPVAARIVGTISRVVKNSSLFAFAAAPYIAAVMVDFGGYTPVLILCVLAQLAGMTLLTRLPRANKKGDPTGPP